VQIPFLKDIILGKSATGLYVYVGADGETLCALATLTKRKEGIFVSNSETGLDFSSVLEKINPAVPLYFNIDGKGVIIRKVDDINDDAGESLLHKAIPNAKPEDFYFQVSGESKGSKILAICRRDAADKYIQQLAQKKCFIHSIEIGFSAILPFLQVIEPEELLLPYWELSDCKNSMPGFAKKTHPSRSYSLGGDQIASDIIIPYTSALQFFTQVCNTGNTSNTSNIVSSQKDDFYYSNLIKKGGIALLGLLFALLLGNYLLFDTYYNTRQKLEQNLASNEMLFRKLEKLKQELDGKKKIISVTSGGGQSRYSYYADQVALTLPSTIQLTDMVFSPLEKKVKKSKPISFRSSLVSITGTVRKSTDLYEWIEVLNQHDWVQLASVVHYAHESGDRNGTFTIEVALERGGDVQK